MQIMKWCVSMINSVKYQEKSIFDEVKRHFQLNTNSQQYLVHHIEFFFQIKHDHILLSINSTSRDPSYRNECMAMQSVLSFGVGHRGPLFWLCSSEGSGLPAFPKGREIAGLNKSWCPEAFDSLPPVWIMFHILTTQNSLPNDPSQLPGLEWAFPRFVFSQHF